MLKNGYFWKENGYDDHRNTYSWNAVSLSFIERTEDYKGVRNHEEWWLQLEKGGAARKEMELRQRIQRDRQEAREMAQMREVEDLNEFWDLTIE